MPQITIQPGLSHPAQAEQQDSSAPTMKALVCKHFGGPQELQLCDFPRPTLVRGYLLVRVIGAGLNFADLLVMRGQYQTKVEPPFIPGVEVHGVVEAVGPDVVGFQVGARVMGQVASGAYAQYVNLDPRQAVKVPPTMTDDHATAFFINYGTAYSALVQRGRARSGGTLLVLGASGGVGLASVQIGRALGMRVIADVRGHEKRQLLEKHGADLLVDFTDAGMRDQVMTYTNGLGCDVIVDMVGGEASRQGLRCIGWCGRLIVIGFAGGVSHAFPANHLLVKNAEVIGHWWGDFHWRSRALLDEAFDALWAMYAKGLVIPQIQEALALEDVPAGLRRFEQRSILGKLIARI